MGSTIYLGRLTLLLVAVGAGCDSSSSGAVAGKHDVSAFVGTWWGLSGSEDITCPDGMTSPDGASNGIGGAILIWAADTTPSDPPDLISTGAGVCGIIFARASGNVASEFDTQTCTYAGNYQTALGRYQGDVTMPSYMFVVAADGTTATENAAGTIVYSFSSGSTLTCTFTETASYQKR